MRAPVVRHLSWLRDVRLLRGLPCLAVLVLAGCASQSPFNTQSARAHVDRLAGTIGSRPAGTQANAQARTYLIETLQLYGFDVRVQETDAAWPEGGITARVANIIAIRNGAVRDAVALVAHYDSVATGPGAGDDALGVAVALEAARVLAARPSPRYSLMVLLTDAEEDGLMGARALVQDEEIRSRLRTYLNLEATGTSGPVPLFETGPGSGPALHAWARAPRPRGGSYMQAIYERLPNDTDFSVFRTLDIFGLNFAAVGDSYAYHTNRDRADRVDPRALASFGANVVDIVTRLDSGTLDRSDARPVYFSVLERTAVVMTSTTARVLGVLAVLLGVVVWLLLARASLRAFGPLAFLMTFAWATIATGAVALALVAAVWLLRAARAELHPWYASPWRLFFFMTMMVIVCTWLVRRLVALMPERVRAIGTPSAVWITALPVWVLIALLLVVYAPAASYLATVPLLIAGLVVPAGLMSMRLLRVSSALVAIGTWAIWAPDAAALLEFSVSIFARLPVVTPTWLFPAMFMAIGVFLWPPVLAMLVGRVQFRLRHGLAGSILAMVLVVSAALVLLADAYTSERPQRRSAAFVDDHVTGVAWWQLSGNEPGVDIAAGPRNVQWEPVQLEARHRLRVQSGAFLFEGRVDTGQAPLPSRVTAVITRHASGADIEVGIAAHTLERLSAAFVLPEPVVPTYSSLVGRTASAGWGARYANVPSAGLVWRATVPASQADALSDTQVWLSWPELPGAEPSSPLPAWLPDTRTAWSTATVVKVGVSADERQEPLPSVLGESRYVPTPHGRLHYYETGSGDTTLVFLHGLGGAATQWRHQLPLAEGRRALFIDLPGHGLSDGQGSTANYSVGAMNASVLVALESAGVRRAVIVGHGLGALIGTSLAQVPGREIEGVVSVNGTLLPPHDSQRFGHGAAMATVPSGASRADLDVAVTGHVAESVPETLRHEVAADLMRTPEHVLRGVLGDYGATGRAKPGAIGSGFPPSPFVEGVRWTGPVLALVSRTAATPGDIEANLRAHYPTLDFRAIDASSQYLMLERPSEVNDAIAGFLLGRGLLR